MAYGGRTRELMAPGTKWRPAGSSKPAWPSRPVTGNIDPECYERQSPVPLVAMRQPNRGRGRAGCSHSPDTRSGAAAQLQPCTPWQRPTDMAEAAGNETGANQPEGLREKPRLQEEGGPVGLLASWGLHPWLFVSAGQQCRRLADPPHSGRARGTRIPRCLAQRAHRAEPILTTQGFWGPFPGCLNIFYQPRRGRQQGCWWQPRATATR